MRDVCAVILIGVITASSAVMPAFAQDRPDQGENVYTVSNIAVDVTADSASTAREEAFENARRKAFRELLDRLVGDNLPERFSMPEAGTIGSFVKNYGIDNEQVSKVRYKGEYSFTFNKEDVRAFLSERGIAYSETRGTPLLVLPFFQQGTQLNLWRGYNPWLDIWSESDVLEGLLPLEIPIGDLRDIRKINGDNALTYNPDKLQSMLERYDASEAVLLIAAFNEGPPPRGMDAPAYTPLTIYIYRTDNDAPQFVRSLYVRPDTGGTLRDLLRRGMKEVASFLRKDWKQQTAVQPGQREKIEAVVRFGGLDEWLDMKKRLRGLGGVDALEIRELSADRARLALGYRGTMRQFGRTLRRDGLQANTFYPGQRGRYGGEGEHNPVMNIRKEGASKRQRTGRPRSRSQQKRAPTRGRQYDRGRGTYQQRQLRSNQQNPRESSGFQNRDRGHQNYGRGY